MRLSLFLYIFYNYIFWRNVIQSSNQSSYVWSECPLSTIDFFFDGYSNENQNFSRRKNRRCILHIDDKVIFWLNSYLMMTWKDDSQYALWDNTAVLMWQRSVICEFRQLDAHASEKWSWRVRNWRKYMTLTWLWIYFPRVHFKHGNGNLIGFIVVKISARDVQGIPIEWWFIWKIVVQDSSTRNSQRVLLQCIEKVSFSVTRIWNCHQGWRKEDLRNNMNIWYVNVVKCFSCLKVMSRKRTTKKKTFSSDRKISEKFHRSFN